MAERRHSSIGKRERESDVSDTPDILDSSNASINDVSVYEKTGKNHLFETKQWMCATLNRLRMVNFFSQTFPHTKENLVHHPITAQGRRKNMYLPHQKSLQGSG